jgi:prepilin-type processing-associated H-X9-DG protein
MENQDIFPQTKRTESDPERNDADGSIEDPDLGSAFVPVLPYISVLNSKNENLERQKVFACPSDPNPFDRLGPTLYNPGGPWLVSYLINGYFIWGMKDSAVRRPSTTIIFSERRSLANQDPHADPFSDDSYKPWFYPLTNPQAPENDMDEWTGAIQTHRHAAGAVYSFCDGHSEWMQYRRTFNPPNFDLHKP